MTCCTAGSVVVVAIVRMWLGSKEEMKPSGDRHLDSSTPANSFLDTTRHVCVSIAPSVVVSPHRERLPRW